VWVWLAENPDRRREIRENPEKIGAVVEELLRVFSVTFSGRTLTQDYELHGVQLKKGDKITSVLPACNYDPKVFEIPREVNFDRARKPVLAFAGGVHSRMGAHLARLRSRSACRSSCAAFLSSSSRTAPRSSTGRAAWSARRACR